MSHVEDKWIKKITTTIIENLGSNVDEAQYEVCGFTNYVMSMQYYLNVKFKNKNGHSEEFSIILKRPIQNEEIRVLTRTNCQFHNEILFYQVYIQPGEHFAKCFYANEQPLFDSVVALENISKRGYGPCPYMYDIPLEYTLAAVREMGRFHGKGYVMKELQCEKFFDIMKQIQEIRYDAKYEWKSMMNVNATRAVEYLRNHGHDVTFCDKMEALFSQAFDNVMMKIAEPREPLSTLCHGDFTLGNILFKTENDKYDAMLIDFALCKYSTPVIDLSTYICLCCSNEMMKDKFFEIMRVYHNALKKYLLEAGVSNIEKYSYEALLDDYRRSGLFGFIIASFYLPIVRGYYTIDIEQLAHVIYVDRGNNAFAFEMKQCGGDEISKILADMLLYLVDLGCLTYF